jgi:hypothetical protein
LRGKRLWQLTFVINGTQQVIRIDRMLRDFYQFSITVAKLISTGGILKCELDPGTARYTPAAVITK